MRRFIATILVLFVVNSVYAHEVRPAFLGISQIDSITYKVTWKIPAVGDLVPKISPSFPDSWVAELKDARQINSSVRREYLVTTNEQINGKTIVIEGQSSTLIDVLINVDLLSGEQYSKILSPDQPFYTIPATSSTLETIKTYLFLGIDHILLGVDHLLFVLALIFITKGKWKIVKTITAFTIAHSITLSMAALELVSIPTPPVEAVIALSIVFLAKEIIQHGRGEETLTYKYPWLVAFSFGLLHGFGFASALSETGLPQNAIPLALAFFNVGVEVGQLIFIGVILLFRWSLNAFKVEVPLSLQRVPIYLIGGVASFWLIERVIGFWQ